MTPNGLRVAIGSDTGRRRQRNEDSGYASPRLLAVADGMGGNPHGEVASRVAIETVSELDARLRPEVDALPQPAQGTEEGAAHGVEESVELAVAADTQAYSLAMADADANARTVVTGDALPALAVAVADVADRLTDLGNRHPAYRDMGTTLTALAWDNHGPAIAHVGDSRAYLLRDGVLHQLTRDHTVAQSLVDNGHITADEAVGHPRASVLMRVLQSGVDVEPDIFRHDARRGDRYLLCSDGVTAVLTPDHLREVLADTGSPDDAVSRLIDLANRCGGPDNITCVVADVGADVPADPVGVGAGVAVGAAGPDHGNPDTSTGAPHIGGRRARQGRWLPAWLRRRRLPSRDAHDRRS